MALHNSQRLNLQAYQREYLDRLFDKPISEMVLPIRRQRLRYDDVFRFEGIGHDPRNHHGRHMHPTVANFITGRRIEFIIIDDLAETHDPRNHTGRYAFA